MNPEEKLSHSAAVKSRLSPCALLMTLLSVISTARASVEKNLEVATEMTCEELLYDATTLYGSIAELEFAAFFALEERS